MSDRQTTETPDWKTAWAVLCGEPNEEGEIEDSGVRAVYDTNEAAAAHVEFANQTLHELGDFPTLIYWVERWDIRTGAFDPEDEKAL